MLNIYSKYLFTNILEIECMKFSIAMLLDIKPIFNHPYYIFNISYYLLSQWASPWCWYQVEYMDTRCL